MGDNKKPILSVLVDEEKKRLFADLARANKQSMGWLLNQAIDKMLEAGSIYVYRDSVIPIDGAIPQQIPSTDIEVVVRRYVEETTAPMIEELGYLKECIGNTATKDYVEKALESVQVAIDAVKQDCDFTTEGVMRLIDAAISKAAIGSKTQTKEPSPKINKTAPGEPSKGIRRVMARLENEPELKAAVIDGLGAGNNGEKLGRYLAEKGFLNSNGAQYTGSSNSQFKLAIEHLNNGG